MSRQHYRRRTYNAGTEINTAASIFIIFLFWNFLSHNPLLLKLEQTINYEIVAVISIACAVVLYKLSRRVYSWKLSQSTSMVSIDAMTGLDFERCVATLLKGLSYKNIKMTEKYDLGIDIIAIRDGVTWGIQIKRYSHLVKADAVRQVVTALRKYNCDRAMVITNSYFSSVAKDLAHCNDCVLIDRQKLYRWL